MKIVYAAGNRSGAGLLLADFLSHSSDEVRVAAYLQPNHFLPVIHWTLDSLPGSRSTLLKAIDKFQPDLVICDGEPNVADIAAEIGSSILYCSPLHLLDGIKWDFGQQNHYTAALYKPRELIRSLPPTDLPILIYSPFGDVAMRPFLRTGYEWIQPYFNSVSSVDDERRTESILAVVYDSERRNKLETYIKGMERPDAVLLDPIKSSTKEYANLLDKACWVLTEGQTKVVADAVYNKKPLCIMPDLKDPEMLLNAICSAELQSRVGFDVGQVELMGKYCTGKLLDAFNRREQINNLSIQNRPKLHERIKALWQE